MITILTWISLIAGGILVFLLLLSIIGGLDFDLDVEVGPSDVDSDGGGLGLIKGILTIASVSSWMIKVLLVSNKSPALAITIGLLCGIVAFALLHYMLKALIKNDSNVNWTMEDAIFQEGTVYLKIPSDGQGIVNVKVKGALREMKAKSFDNEPIDTGASITVMEVDGDDVIVKKMNT